MGALLVGDARQRKWKPNEAFFLQAVGDQLLLSVTHTRLRSLVRTLAVADEKAGLLTRGAYIDCLLSESNRARTHGTPLSLVVIEIDRGGELLKQYGDTVFESYIDQLARALCSSIRQTDVAVKYTAWSLVFILPDTIVANARRLSEKLRQIAETVRPPWEPCNVTISAVAAECSSRASEDAEDRVTEWINRAEAGLEEVRQSGGNSVMALATP
jgi:diguanylate cyclase (GGDEF)-like protein